MPSKSKESRAEKAGVPKSFSFDGKTYRIGSASTRQYFELEELIKKFIPDPVREAARELGEIGQYLTPEERKAILDDAKEQRKKQYVTRVKIFWDDECEDPVRNIISGSEGDFTKRDSESLGIDESMTIGQVCRIAWKRGARPNSESEVNGTLTRLRDALNEYFNDSAQEITEQVSGWPPPLESSEAYMALYVGPGLPETLAILLPPHNQGMTRDEAKAIGNAILEDTTGEGMQSLSAVLSGGDEEEDEDKSKSESD